MEENALSLWHKLKNEIKINKNLVPLKMVVFLYYGGWSLYFPYLTLHMVQVGLSIEDIAIIYAVLPFVSFLGPPVAGILADKFGNYRIVLVLTVLFAAIFHTSLLHVNPRNLEDLANSRSVVEDAELVCDPSGSTYQWRCNDSIRGMDTWRSSVLFSAINCSSSCSQPEMQLCYSARNCTSLIPSAESELKVGFVFETSALKNGESICSGSVIDTIPESSSSDPGTLFCNCRISCPLAVETLHRNSTSAKDSFSISRKEFWIYFVLRIMASVSLGTSLSMLDATTICMVKKYDGNLGKQRICGAVGQVVFGLAAGGLLDFTVRFKGFQDFASIFYMGDAIFALVVLLVTRLDVSAEKVEGRVVENFKKLLRLGDVNVFLVMMLLLGACWGFLESFYFVFLTEILAESYMLGMTVALGCVAGLPFLYVSDSIVKNIGEVNIIVLAFITYGVRFLAYSFIWNPWLCLPFEISEAITVHLMGVASAIYCSAAAPPGLLATLNGAVGSFHYSFGRGLGSFVGGTFMSQFGTRPTFQIFGTCAVCVGIFYFVLHRFYLKKLEALRTRRKSQFLEASGMTPADLEAMEPMIIPPDELLARRMSCF